MSYIKHFVAYWVVGSIASLAVIFLTSFLSFDFDSADKFLVNLLKPGVKLAQVITDVGFGIALLNHVFILSSVVYGFFIAVIAEALSSDI
jgi:hypothetical protein